MKRLFAAIMLSVTVATSASAAEPTMREFFEMSTRAQSVVVIGSLKIAERAGTCRYTDDNAKMLVMLLYLSNVRTARANEPASLVITEGIRTMDRGGLCN